VTTTLARIIISVSDLDRALALYRDVLRLSVNTLTPPIARLQTDGPSVEVMLHERLPTPGDAGVAPSFAVDDVDAATSEAVAAGAIVLDAPTDQPWGERQSVLRDPDGHVICLVAATRPR